MKRNKLLFILIFSLVVCAIPVSTNAAASKPVLRRMTLLKGYELKVDKKNYTAYAAGRPEVCFEWDKVTNAVMYNIRIYDDDYDRDNYYGVTLKVVNNNSVTYRFHSGKIEAKKIVIEAIDRNNKVISRDVKYISGKSLLTTKQGQDLRLYTTSQTNNRNSTEKIAPVSVQKSAGGSIVLFQCQHTRNVKKVRWDYSPVKYGCSYSTEYYELKWFPVNKKVTAKLYFYDKTKHKYIYRYSKTVKNTWKGKLAVHVSGDSDKTVSGIKFGVYKSDKKTKVTTMTTDKNGYCKIAISPGTYYLKQINNIKGQNRLPGYRKIIVNNKKTTHAFFSFIVPTITIDRSCLSVYDTSEAVIRGTVSRSKGQIITLYAGDRKTILAEQKMGNSGKKSSFEIIAPEDSIACPGTTTLYVKSQAGKTIAESEMVKLSVTFIVPTITIDKSCLSVTDTTQAVIKGTISKARGQTITLYAGDQKKILAEKKLGNTGKASTFEITAPKGSIRCPGRSNLYVKSQPVKTVAASAMTKLTVISKKSQAIKGVKTVTLTNLKEKTMLDQKAESGGTLKYVSKKPSVVSVTKKGKITRHKNGKAKIIVTQAGKNYYLPAKKEIVVVSRKSNCKEQIDAAVDWAVKIANDNSFSYGAGDDAHHNGCYFCGTNYGPKKYYKPSRKYKKTYCCNPFVHAAYAHGAKNPKMLSDCRKAHSIDMKKDSYYKYKCWKCVGKPAMKNLKKGDVMVTSKHVAMYIGNNRYVDAAYEGWGAGTIAVRKLTKSNYNGYSFVMRYTGY